MCSQNITQNKSYKIFIICIVATFYLILFYQSNINLILQQYSIFSNSNVPNFSNSNVLNFSISNESSNVGFDFLYQKHNKYSIILYYKEAKFILNRCDLVPKNLGTCMVNFEYNFLLLMVLFL